MTYCEYVFELETEAQTEELQAALRGLWNGPGRGHCVLAKESTRLCVLSTHAMVPGDGTGLEKVLSYLRTRAKNNEVWYIRDIECWRYGAPIGKSISLPSLVSEADLAGEDGWRHPVAA
ncbi:MAG: hypothetical protein RL318_764 [Fibrobacterota bacterium]|jgi:hypothetical protein